MDRKEGQGNCRATSNTTLTAAAAAAAACRQTMVPCGRTWPALRHSTAHRCRCQSRQFRSHDSVLHPLADYWWALRSALPLPLGPSVCLAVGQPHGQGCAGQACQPNHIWLQISACTPAQTYTSMVNCKHRTTKKYGR
eukprot:1147329-Pelagomonas_calceolata.AAC.7